METLISLSDLYVKSKENLSKNRKQFYLFLGKEKYLEKFVILSVLWARSVLIFV